jgi:hypothetical protein
MAALISVATVVCIIYGIYGVIRIIGALLAYDFLTRNKWKEVFNVESVEIKEVK